VRVKKMSEKCYICEKGNLVKKEVDYLLLGENLGKFAAEVCDTCGEQFFDEEASKKIEVVAKKRGLWGLESKSKIAKVGNSYAIRINKRIAEFLDLKKGEDVSIIPENKHKLLIQV